MRMGSWSLGPGTSSSGCINYGFDFKKPPSSHGFSIRSNFAFSKKPKYGFGRNEGVQKTKVMVLGTNY
jgi:hypothetical protein